jgi:hypothetical protein
MRAGIVCGGVRDIFETGSGRYVPPAGDAWETRTPEEMGMSSARLQEEHDLVTVTRWVDGREHVDESIRLVLEAVSDES